MAPAVVPSTYAEVIARGERLALCPWASLSFGVWVRGKGCLDGSQHPERIEGSFSCAFLRATRYFSLQCTSCLYDQYEGTLPYIILVIKSFNHFRASILGHAF